MASSRFELYKPESLRDVREQETKLNPVLEGMKEEWAGCTDLDLKDDEKSYSRILERIRGMEYSAEDIEAFSVSLVGIQDEYGFSSKAGLFLSALMNSCEAERFAIHTAHLDKHIDKIGYCNAKDIIVNGDAGLQLGSQMKRGSIRVRGNAGTFLGDRMEDGGITVEGHAGNQAGYGMKGGTLVVWGDAGDETGFAMSDGSITVKGNAGQRVGSGMKGGLIRVERNAGDGVGSGMYGGDIWINGEMGGISDVTRAGRIFHKGMRMELD